MIDKPVQKFACKGQSKAYAIIFYRYISMS